MLVVLTGDRGLCGGFNNFIIKLALSRIQQLSLLGVPSSIFSIGSKGSTFFLRRFLKCSAFLLGSSPTVTKAQAIADSLLSSFVSSQFDKVELLFTKFVSLINSLPSIQTLLPMTRSG